MNTSHPLVSIITPTYNHEKYISDCIKSVQEQLYSNWEMIIVDDGSTDSTYSIACGFAKLDNRIKVYTQKNVGIFRLSETYNFALSESKGKYIAVLEGDDVWFPEKLQLQVETMENDDTIVLSWGRAYSSKENLIENYDLYPVSDLGNAIFTNTPIGSSSKVLIFYCFMPALTVLIRRSSLEEIGGFIQNFNLPLVDLPTWQQLSLKGSFSYINTPIGKWRIYPTQITKTYTAEMAEGFYKLAISFFKQNQEFFLANNITRSKINKYYRSRFVIAYSRSGRYKLIRKDFKAARKDYTRSIFKYGFNEPIWKLRSIIGILFSLFRLDIENFARLLGRNSYK